MEQRLSSSWAHVIWECGPILLQPCLTWTMTFSLWQHTVVSAQNNVWGRGRSLSGVMTLPCHKEDMCRPLPYWSEGKTVRVSLDSGLCVHLKVCICCLALHLLTKRLSLGLRGSGTHGKLHLRDPIMDDRARLTVRAKSPLSSVLGNVDKRVNIYFYIPII